MKLRQSTNPQLVRASAAMFQLSLVFLVIGAPALSAETAAHDELQTKPEGAAVAENQQPGSPQSQWHYGAYLDLSYPIDFNFPQNHLWRSKGTTQRVNELTPNMILGYIRKDADGSSRWGMEFAVQGGYDV